MIWNEMKKQMDELKLSLTGGANGYTIRLKELLVRGASNYTVEDIKLGSPFEAVVRMPTLVLDAQYTRCVRSPFLTRFLFSAIIAGQSSCLSPSVMQCTVLFEFYLFFLLSFIHWVVLKKSGFLDWRTRSFMMYWWTFCLN